MRVFRPNPAALRLLLSISLTMGLTACNPGRGNSNPDSVAPPVAKISAVSETTTTCEGKLRAQMRSKSLLFQTTAGFEKEISEANQLFAQADQQKFDIRQTNDINSTAMLEHYHLTETSRLSFIYELSISDKHSTAPLRLKIRNLRADARKNRELNQIFQVSAECEMSLSQTRYEVLRKVTDSDYGYNSLQIFSGSEPIRTEKTYQVPDGSPILNLSPHPEEPEYLKDKMSVFIEDIGMFTGSVKPMPVQKVKNLGLEILLEERSVVLTDQGGTSISCAVGHDANLEISLTQVGSQKTWTLSQSLWNQQLLGSSQDLNESVTMALPKDYLYSHDSFLLVTNKRPDYEHLSAYWKISDLQSGTTTQSFSMRVSENQLPTIEDKTVPADLASNSTVQTEIPEIQAIVQNILKKAPTDRTAQIQLILTYLDENYTFDQAMMKNNTIHALSTREALTRGKGVCQHYSVIFTALARALKIPTRIIVGYLMAGDSPGAHAWVETQVIPGVWQVIEPQRKDGLTTTHTRFYFPLAHGRFLEDVDISMSNYVSQILLLEASIRPL